MELYTTKEGLCRRKIFEIDGDQDFREVITVFGKFNIMINPEGTQLLVYSIHLQEVDRNMTVPIEKWSEVRGDYEKYFTVETIAEYLTGFDETEVTDEC